LRLHDTDGLSWREIASLDEFSGVPHHILYDLAMKDIEPMREDYRRILGLSEILIQKVHRDKRGRFAPPPKEDPNENQIAD
jgi:hypothetical protein